MEFASYHNLIVVPLPLEMVFSSAADTKDAKYYSGHTDKQSVFLLGGLIYLQNCVLVIQARIFVVFWYVSWVLLKAICISKRDGSKGLKELIAYNLLQWMKQLLCSLTDCLINLFP